MSGLVNLGQCCRQCIYLSVCVFVCVRVCLQVQIFQTGLREGISHRQCADIHGRGEVYRCTHEDKSSFLFPLPVPQQSPRETQTQHTNIFGSEKSGRVNISSLRLLTGWWGGAIPTDGKTRQGWWWQAPQHVREKVRVGGHREAVEVGTRYWVAFARHDVRSWPSVTKTLEQVLRVLLGSWVI